MNDYLLWTEKIIDGIDLSTLQKEIVETKNPAFAYFFALDFHTSLHLMQKIILDAKDAKYSYLFALDIPNADINALQDIVIKSNKIKYINQFDSNIKSAHHKLLQSIILKSKKPKYLLELAKRTKNAYLLKKIEDILVETHEYTYMRLFAENIEGANIERLEQAILDGNDSDEAKKFAARVKNSTMKQFLLLR